MHRSGCSAVTVTLALVLAVLVVASSAPYPGLFGAGQVSPCFGIAFHGLGAAGARYDFTPGGTGPTR